MQFRSTLHLLTALLLLHGQTADCNPILLTRAHVTVRLLKEDPAGTPGWLENIAARSNGDLLLTSIRAPGNLHLFKPLTPDLEPVEISGFDYSSTLGITEGKHDVFYVLSSDFDIQKVTVQPNTNTVWKVDFNRCELETGLPIPKKIATLPGAVFLNGLTTFDENTLLAADSAAGLVWAIDIRNGQSKIAADDPLMKPVGGQSYLEGINGLHIRPNTTGHLPRQLCFTNSQRFTFSCMNLDHDAMAEGRAWHVANPRPEKGFSAINWDDFAFDHDGTAYVATEKGNSVQTISPAGEVSVLAGNLNSTIIGTPTSTAFGRTFLDRRTLYVVTAGNLFFPIVVDGKNQPTGAQLVAVDLE